MKHEKSKVIPRSWEVPGIFHRRLGQAAGRQRAMVHDEHLLLIAHEVPEAGVPERKALLIWRHPDGLWKTDGAGGGLPALKALLDRYGTTIDELEAELAKADVAKDLFEVLRAANPVHRAVSNLLNALQFARERIEDKDIISQRDRAYDLTRAAALLVEDAKAAMEYDIARVAEMQTRISNDLARSGHRLNLLAALFLPVTAVASVFGMNLPSGIEQLAAPWLFWGTLVVGLLVGLVVRSFLGGGPVPANVD